MKPLPPTSIDLLDARLQPAWEFTTLQAELFRIWSALPRDGHNQVPRKSVIKAGLFAKIAPHLGMAEYIDTYHLKIRFIGTAVDEQQVGSNLTNINAFDVYGPVPREYFAKMWSLAIQSPCGLLGNHYLHVARGRRIEQYSMHLPLCDDDDRVRFLLSCFEYPGATLAPEHSGKIVFPDAESVGRCAFVDLGAGIPSFVRNEWVLPSR